MTSQTGLSIFYFIQANKLHRQMVLETTGRFYMTNGRRKLKKKNIMILTRSTSDKELQ